MIKKQITAKLDGVVMGSELIDVTQTFAETIADTRFTDIEKQANYNYGFNVWRQHLLRDGGMSTNDKKKYRNERARENLANGLGYASYDELMIAVEKDKMSKMSENI